MQTAEVPDAVEIVQIMQTLQNGIKRLGIVHIGMT